MATPYTASSPARESPSRQWQEPPRNTTESPNFRSVTPAMNNTRGVVRNSASPAPTRGASPSGAGNGPNVDAHYNNRSGTPSRYLGSFNSPDATQPQASRDNQTPTSTGLIRLTLRKPMGIVFEPMYDPNSPSVQRGVRICDLPRTGAAALSRKLEVGDELLSINDKTMSRLTFDEIMDFIIEADPEEVNLLFRRPRKEVLNARHGVKMPSTNNSGPGVKWVDDEHREKRKAEKSKKPPEKKSGDRKGSRKGGKNKDDDETAQSEDNDYRNRSKKKGRGRNPYETESFLDLLIDTICANPDNVCRDRRRQEDDEYYSDEDDGTFASRDDSTYVTYESEQDKKKEKAKAKSQNRDDDSSTYQETEDDTLEDTKRKKREKESSRSSPPKESKRATTPEKNRKSHKYEDDGTLDTVDSAERMKVADSEPEIISPPLGLSSNPNPDPIGADQQTDTDDEGNPAPIREVEYDDQVDHGADVSVMESLGGPSLLIEKQRQAAIMASKQTTPAPTVPREIMENFGHDYPLDFGFSREQTIQNDPLRFYTHVVKSLLQQHEPEKVRLLDKLLAKYKGREDHLVQKLSVRYNKEEEGVEQNHEEYNHHDAGGNFEDAVKRGKDSATASAAIKTAKERMQHADRDFDPTSWPDKETKEPDDGDQQSAHEEGSESGSDYSHDSIDGTSPAVIAQVSELLNYVYGKTSVPGQIDRVSTIMRAYEGREAVLLELLETKALIKANREKENAGQLPSFLRNSANAQRNLEHEIEAHGDVPAMTPMATQPQGVGGAVINDDISSMSGVSSPAGQEAAVAAGVLKQITVSGRSFALFGSRLFKQQRSRFQITFRLTRRLHHQFPRRL